MKNMGLHCILHLLHLLAVSVQANIKMPLVVPFYDKLSHDCQSSFVFIVFSTSTKEADNNNRDNRLSTSRIHFLGDAVKYGTNSTVSETQVQTRCCL